MDGQYRGSNPLNAVFFNKVFAMTEAIEKINDDQVKVTANDLIIEVATGFYPVTLELIRVKHPQCSFAKQPYLQDIEDLGYEVVQPTLRPEGDVITEGAPKLDNGVWYRTWVARSWSAEELAAKLVDKKSTLNATIMRVREDDFEMGVTYSPVDGTEFNVQLRTEDRVNLVMLNLQAQSALSKEEDTLEKFRSYENETFELTPQQVVDMTAKALAGIKSIYQQSWEFKDKIDKATAIEDLPVIPRTFILAE